LSKWRLVRPSRQSTLDPEANGQTPMTPLPHSRQGAAPKDFAACSSCAHSSSWHRRWNISPNLHLLVHIARLESSRTSCATKSTQIDAKSFKQATIEREQECASCSCLRMDTLRPLLLYSMSVIAIGFGAIQGAQWLVAPGPTLDAAGFGSANDSQAGSACAVRHNSRGRRPPRSQRQEQKAASL
jgi:hypothetical protein